MTNYSFVLTGSYSIIVAAVAGLIRLRALHRAYQPFVFITLASLTNEVISHVLITHQKSNAVAINVFGIVDAALWLWQFKMWSSHDKDRLVLKICMIAMMLLWFVENIVYEKIFVFGSVYPITFSIVMVMLSAIGVSRQVAREKDNLLSTPKFLICCGAIFFYTYRIFVECFFAPGLTKSQLFLSNVFIILSFVNFFVNILYALAVLWIPQKKKFSLPYC
jgi:hypothetical protein